MMRAITQQDVEHFRYLASSDAAVKEILEAVTFYFEIERYEESFRTLLGHRHTPFHGAWVRSYSLLDALNGSLVHLVDIHEKGMRTVLRLVRVSYSVYLDENDGCWDASTLADLVTNMGYAVRLYPPHIPEVL